jgi:hypothetical protein
MKVFLQITVVQDNQFLQDFAYWRVILPHFLNCFKEFNHGRHSNLEAKVTATSSIATL